MYSLSIFFGPSPVPAQFLFKDKEKADAAYSKVTSFSEGLGFMIEDEFGHRAGFTWAAVHGAALEDMDLGEESRIQRGLSQARGQAKANERARTDPALRASIQTYGPSMITPFSNGRFTG